MKHTSVIALILSVIITLTFVGCSSDKSADTSSLTDIKTEEGETSSEINSFIESSSEISSAAESSAEISSAAESSAPESSATSESKSEKKANPTESSQAVKEEPKPENPSIYTYEHISVVLPKDFSVDESTDFPIALAPNSTDSIAFSKSPADSIDNYSRDYMEEIYRQLFQFFEQTLEYSEMKINGIDTIKYSFKSSMDGVDMIQTQYMIFGSTFSNIVTFTDATGEYTAAFDACAATITVNQ